MKRSHFYAKQRATAALRRRVRETPGAIGSVSKFTLTDIETGASVVFRGPAIVSIRSNEDGTKETSVDLTDGSCVTVPRTVYRSAETLGEDRTQVLMLPTMDEATLRQVLGFPSGSCIRSI